MNDGLCVRVKGLVEICFDRCTSDSMQRCLPLAVFGKSGLVVDDSDTDYKVEMMFHAYNDAVLSWWIPKEFCEVLP